MNYDIIRFWKWFVENEGVYRNEVVAPKAWTLLEKQLLALGVSGWEVGPDASDPLTHALSLFANDRESLQKNSKIVFHAPNVERWKFYPSRQRKLWDRIFFWPEIGKVDASDWKFNIYQYDDGKYEFSAIINDNNILNLSSKDKENILFMILSSELGESWVIENTAVISAEQFNTANSKHSIPITELRNTIQNKKL